MLRAGESVLRSASLLPDEARWEKATEFREDIFGAINLVGKTYADLPQDRIEFQRIQGTGYQGELAVNEIKYDPVTPDLLEGERKYWVHHFNASAHFSQTKSRTTGTKVDLTALTSIAALLQCDVPKG